VIFFPRRNSELLVGTFEQVMPVSHKSTAVRMVNLQPFERLEMFSEAQNYSESASNTFSTDGALPHFISCPPVLYPACTDCEISISLLKLGVVSCIINA